jgi:hypothetical protein
MKAHPDTQASRYPPNRKRDWDHLPAKHEKSSHRSCVTNDHEKSGVPSYSATLINIARLVVHGNSGKKYSVISFDDDCRTILTSGSSCSCNSYVISLFAGCIAVNEWPRADPSTCLIEQDSALLLCYSFSPASTVMRHA